MIHLPNEEISYWKSSTTGTTYKPLNENLDVDVVIIGGGITGLVAAYLLKKSGLTVAVLEKNRLASGTTGGTTGKVTSQHGLIYKQLHDRLGEKSARVYAQATQTAVENIAKVIAQEKMDCGWKRADNYVYTADRGQLEQFKAEASIAVKLGLPASFETNLPLPFNVEGAVKFADQANIHARAYTLGLAAIVDGGGSYIFENSNVVGIRDGSPATVRTADAKVTAKDIIVATKVPAAPLIARGAYSVLEYPHTSYVVAGWYENELNGMYISPDNGHYSILPVKAGKKRLLLIGGENHIPGLGSPHKRHQRLADYAEKHFGISSIAYRWKAMDYIAYDSVPLIGKVYPWSKHLYTATGFKKWGLSTSMVAGMILRDLIQGQENPWAAVFNTMRTSPVKSIPRVIAQSFK